MTCKHCSNTALHPFDYCYMCKASWEPAVESQLAYDEGSDITDGATDDEK